MSEKEFVEAMMYVFKAPIIVFQGQEYTITEEQKQRVRVERLKMVAKGLTNLSTDFEAMLYIMTASLANPIENSWVKLYGTLFRQFFPNNTHLIEGLEEASEHELGGQLLELKHWIFKKQAEALKEAKSAKITAGNNPQLFG